MIDLDIRLEGEWKVIAELEQLRARIANPRIWQAAIQRLLDDTRVYTRGISPVWTGAYRSSHTVAVAGRRGVMGIHPGVRNPITGDPVTRYAPDVELRHGVYMDAFVQATRLAVGALWEVLGVHE